MTDIKKCDHKWKSAGFWDGITADSKPTGGMMFKCELCGEQAFSMEQIKEKGGSIVEEK